MEITITLGNIDDLEGCVEALCNSELGRQYMPDPEIARTFLLTGLAAKQIFIARTAEGECVGFLWMVPDGMFCRLPYIRGIAVKQQYRGQGIGTQLLSHAEAAARSASKIFLLVSSFNPRAKQLYQRQGYSEVGSIPSLFKEGVDECLLYKTLSETNLHE